MPFTTAIFLIVFLRALFLIFHSYSSKHCYMKTFYLWHYIHLLMYFFLQNAITKIIFIHGDVWFWDKTAVPTLLTWEFFTKNLVSLMLHDLLFPSIVIVIT